MKVLHVAAEVHPLVKTGGLADVLGALPQALRAQGGVDSRLLLPGWPAVMKGVVRTEGVSTLGPCFGAARVTLMRAEMPDSGLPIYVIDAPLLYDRPGNPYHDEAGQEWPDNLQRFGLLGWVALQLAAGKLDPSWEPDLLHAHDWHAGMACAYLKSHACTVPSVFTVHNLAYQGLFPHQDGPLLGLSARFMSSAGLEFHGQLSFMKAGLKFADRLTTVSPRYAQEITTPEFGCGLDGVLRSRAGALSGILNGIDPTVWDPTSDSAIAQPFSLVDLSGKAACKSALQTELGLPADPQAPLLLALSRLTAQKGLDLLLEALPGLMSQGLQVVVQGTGDAALETALVEAAARYHGRMAVLIGYDEKRAHRLMAGADLLAVPSRFEPCGLTQMYALRYGTLPVVRATGGLADTVVAESDERNSGLLANGFTFAEASAKALEDALTEAISVWRDPPRRSALQRSGMGQDFSWTASALRYRALYESLCTEAGRA